MKKAGAFFAFSLALLLFGGLGKAEAQIAGLTNDWTKSTSGSWEEPYWSLGRLPAPDQETVAFRNPGWKALAIGGNTAVSYPSSLAVNNLIVDAPTDSFNRLLLNWAGLVVPLVVRSNLFIGSGGSLESHYSALRAATANIRGSASFSDYATEDFGTLWLRSGATLNLINGSMTCSSLTFGSATLTQSGGSHVVQNINLPVVENPFAEAVSGSYLLQDGALVSEKLSLGYGIGPFGSGDGHGTFRQSGGVHTNSVMNLQAYYHPGGSTFAGSYLLAAGLLVSSSVTNDGGYFGQDGGTNIIQELTLKGGSAFELNGGELVASNITDNVDTYVGGGFVQAGGMHTVRGRLLVQRGRAYPSSPEYSLSGGALVTANIELGGILQLSSHGILTNQGILLLSGGTLVALNAAEAQQLGQLQCAGGTLNLHGYGPSTNATVWRFSDSRSLPWTGALRINNWGALPGDHIFVGTNAQGLTAAQLDQVQFLGYNYTTNPAALLANGELVPVSETNEWTKPTSGNWEESYWSLGRLPGLDQNLVVFSNSGVKDLTIGPNTTANYPNSLSLYTLVIDSPSTSFNRLVLNWAGLDVPLSVHWNLTIGTNSSLVSHDSALQAAKTYISGSLSLLDGSVANLDEIWLGASGAFDFSDASITSSKVGFGGGTLTQNGGTHVAQQLTLPAHDYYALGYSGQLPPASYYYLHGGTLVSQDALLDSSHDRYGGTTFGAFVQSGGVHTNFGLTLYNRSSGTAKGSYILNGGLLASTSVYPYGGSFTQHGGTNIIGELRDAGYFTLDGGRLISSNTTVVFDTFVQAGGTHLVTSRLLIGAGYDYEGGRSIYDLAGGDLVTSNIDLSTGTLSLSSHGAVSNAGILTFSSYFPGAVRANNVNAVQYLGQLQMSYGGTLDLHASPNQPINATVLRLLDSHALSWSEQLQITNWGLNPGDHIFFGTDSQALTEVQLAQIQFTGNNTTSPAKLLTTGELVPAFPPPLFARKVGNAMVLSWPGGGYELLTATNVSGPYLPVAGATSPMTNALSGSQGYFRLRMPSP